MTAGSVPTTEKSVNEGSEVGERDLRSRSGPLMTRFQPEGPSRTGGVRVRDDATTFTATAECARHPNSDLSSTCHERYLGNKIFVRDAGSFGAGWFIPFGSFHSAVVQITPFPSSAP